MMTVLFWWFALALVVVNILDYFKPEPVEDKDDEIFNELIKESETAYYAEIEENKKSLYTLK